MRSLARHVDALAGRPVGERPVARTAKGHGGLLAAGGSLEMQSDVLHTVIPGVGAVELGGTAGCRTHHVFGKLAARAGGVGLELTHAVFNLTWDGLSRARSHDGAAFESQVHAADVLGIEIFAIEDGAEGRERGGASAGRRSASLAAGTLGADPVAES